MSLDKARTIREVFPTIVQFLDGVSAARLAATNRDIYQHVTPFEKKAMREAAYGNWHQVDALPDLHKALRSVPRQHLVWTSSMWNAAVHTVEIGGALYDVRILRHLMQTDRHLSVLLVELDHAPLVEVLVRGNKVMPPSFLVRIWEEGWARCNPETLVHLTLFALGLARQGQYLHREDSLLPGTCIGPDNLEDVIVYPEGLLSTAALLRNVLPLLKTTPIGPIYST